MRMKEIMSPESLMMSYGYKPELSEGAVKAPLFQTSTFTFKTAEEGKSFFELAYGLRPKKEGEKPGLLYSRINNPNLEILENRLCLWDKAEDCAVFASGMSAITTVLLEFLKPGDVMLYSSPTYGGTDHFIVHFFEKIGVRCISFNSEHDEEDIIQLVKRTNSPERLRCIFIETPANPTNDLFDIQMCRRVANYFSTPESKVTCAVDNTFMGPLWSKPLQHGADLVIYSATKYIGGQSDLIAGAVLGNADLIERIKTLRTFLGNMPSPHTCWLLMRSLETLKIRMDQQAKNARIVAIYLENHPNIERVHFLGNIDRKSKAYNIYKEQYSSTGAMISFEVRGGEPEAFRFLNNLQLIKLAVSLGSTESLVQHPASMTHAGIPPEIRRQMGIKENLVRLSIGVENNRDLIWDIDQALQKAYAFKKKVSQVVEELWV